MVVKEIYAVQKKTFEDLTDHYMPKDSSLRLLLLQEHREMGVYNVLMFWYKYFFLTTPIIIDELFMMAMIVKTIKYDLWSP